MYSSHHVRDRVRQEVRAMSFNREVPSFTPIPRVVAVSGGKGGVGKTLTTANLGICLSHLGLKTLLIDADMGLANLDVLFNVRPTVTLDDVLTGEAKLKDIAIPINDSLKIIPSSSGCIQIPELTTGSKTLLHEQIEEYDEVFDIILIDTPAGVSQNVKYWVRSAQDVILLTTPEPTSLSDCYATMKILSQGSQDYHFKLIVNMTKSEEEALKIYERLSYVAEDYLNVNLSYMGHILYDEIVKLSVHERIPYAQKYPFSKPAESLRQMARLLTVDHDARFLKSTSAQFFFRKVIQRTSTPSSTPLAS
jgi:flagellar biosynthesis protein FlhG